MKLYFVPGACSMAPHIVLCEAAFDFEMEKVDLGAGKTASGNDFNKINPKGYVPVLELDDGQCLTEAAVIVQYLADQKAEAGLAPELGTLERYRLMEWLNFISAEIHKAFGPLWHANTPEQTKQAQRVLLARRFDYVGEYLKGRSYLLGDRFTVADAYLFTVLNWTNVLNIKLDSVVLKDYLARIASRPKVRAAMQAEGLLNER